MIATLAFTLTMVHYLNIHNKTWADAIKKSTLDNFPISEKINNLLKPTNSPGNTFNINVIVKFIN